jgi:hypothetical protein
LQASRASDTETLQSQVNKAAKKRLSLSELEILQGRLCNTKLRRHCLICATVRARASRPYIPLDYRTFLQWMSQWRRT